MLFRLSSVILFVLVTAFSATVSISQDAVATPEPVKPIPTPNGKDLGKLATAEQVVDATLVIYGFPGGRATLDRIRKTTLEKGKMTVTNPDGASESANYQRWILRGETLGKERIRLEQEFSNARYSLLMNGEKIYGVYNNSVFSPREDAVNGFSNSIFHGPEALLRYKENGSTLELAGRDKMLGVDLYLIDVTDTLGRKTRFYISAKTYRIMALTFEEAGVKYKRKFYNQKYAQGTLVPFRTVLTADDKVIEEVEIGTITFGQRVEDTLFPAMPQG